MIYGLGGEPKNLTSPDKKSTGGLRLLQKAATVDEKAIRSFETTELKISPLKQKMRMFEDPNTSPQK